MSHLRPDFRSAAALTAAAACWGAATVITKSILASVPPITLLVLQLAFSLTLLGSFVFLNRKRFAPTRDLWKLGGLGLLNPGISYTLSLLGLTTTTASMSTLLWASEPVLIIGLAALLLRERLTPRLLIFSALAFFGVLWVSGLATDAGVGSATFGNLLILGGVLCCALYTVLSRRIGSNIDPLFAVALQQTCALIWAVCIWPLELLRSDTSVIVQLAVDHWFWIGLSGITYYALAFWFYLRGLAQVNASVAGTFINLIPIFGIAGGYVFLGERLSMAQWIGATAILISVFAILLWPDRRTHSDSPTIAT